MKLDDAGVLLMMLSAVIVIGCLLLVFVLESSLPVPLLVLGHACAMVGAVGFKVGYVMRLEARVRQQSR
ncbi:MAG TPA: hypothetical protein VM553_18775 [Dongiaceae bacterium]|nr:hypothetical protein [Dongiaceae bacterium]